tara:strand:- start:4582 stop:5394 length:813 start_codon:yes stop_codon:yes gene_type:complete
MSFKLSIIIVCFNSEKYIADAIESVICQSCNLWELVIVNGDSQDKTDSIIKKYLDYVAVYINEPDNGIYNAMNKGSKLATGSHISFLNSDDVYLPEYVEEIYHCSNYKRFPFFVSPVRLVSENKRELALMLPMNNHSKKYLSACIPFPHLGLTTDIKVFRDLNGFDEKWRFCSDYDFCLRLIKEYQYNYLCLIKPFTKFRAGGASYGFKSNLDTFKMREYHFNSLVAYKCLLRSLFIRVASLLIPKFLFVKLRKIFTRSYNYKWENINNY